MGTSGHAESWAPRFGTDEKREYDDCAICGFTYPKDQLVPQNGVLVCTETCHFTPHPAGENPK